MFSLKQLVVLLSVLASAAGTVGVAQTSGQREEFTAIAMANNNIMSGADRVIMRVTRWSTEGESAMLVEAMKKGPSDLLEALRRQRSVGTIRTPDTLGYDLRYAFQEPTDEGGRRVVLATDRPIGFWESLNQPRTIDYPFTVIQMEFDRNGAGKGTMSLFTKISLRANTIVLEDFTTAPVVLTTIEARPISGM